MFSLHFHFVQRVVHYIRNMCTCVCVYEAHGLCSMQTFLQKFGEISCFQVMQFAKCIPRVGWPKFNGNDKFLLKFLGSKGYAVTLIPTLVTLENCWAVDVSLCTQNYIHYHIINDIEWYQGIWKSFVFQKTIFLDNSIAHTFCDANDIRLIL